MLSGSQVLVQYQQRDSGISLQMYPSFDAGTFQSGENELGCMHWNEAGLDPDRCNMPLSTDDQEAHGQVDLTSDVSQLADDLAPLALRDPSKQDLSLQFPCVLSKAQLQHFRPTYGSKSAVAECRRLRQWCLLQRPMVDRVVLTSSEFQWQSLLRGMHEPLLAKIFGPAEGISQFNFLLLRNCRDHNYDGPRHVFEIIRTSGVACHLHFHKNGKPDEPYEVQPGDYSLTGNATRSVDYFNTMPQAS